MMQTFTTEQFTWDGRTGTTEASDLGFRAGDQLPDNFLVKSSKTGSSLCFWRKGQEFRDGDLLWTTYWAVSDGIYVFVKLFND